jgi:hypothetical protein
VFLISKWNNIYRNLFKQLIISIEKLIQMYIIFTRNVLLILPNIIRILANFLISTSIKAKVSLKTT